MSCEESYALYRTAICSNFFRSDYIGGGGLISAGGVVIAALYEHVGGKDR